MSSVDNALSELIRGFIQSREQEKLEKFDKESQKSLQTSQDDDRQSIAMARQQERSDLVDSFRPNTWLDDAANRASQIQLATHAPKYTHPDAKASSIYAVFEQNESQQFLSSASFESPVVDVVGNAAVLDVGKLLGLSDGTQTLIDSLLAGDLSPLMPFAKDEQQAKEWGDKFKAITVASEPSAHKLIKQVYWPVEHGYHLLTPLFASSLTQAIHEKVEHSRFDGIQIEAREAQRGGKYHGDATVYFPNLAVQNFGGSNKQNISQLNSTRNGKSYLLNCAPPTWKSTMKLPLKVNSVFQGPFSRIVYPKIQQLRSFLTSVKDRPSLSRYKIARKAMQQGIVDELLLFRWRYQEFDAGWSSQPECELPLHQQLWLDPGRREQDKDFEYAFDSKEWQGKVAEDFSRFFNKQLEFENKLVTDDSDFVQWKVDAAQQLRLLLKDYQEAL